MDKLSWNYRVRTEEILLKVKEERNILHAIKRRKGTWLGQILRRKCLLKHFIEGNNVRKDVEEDVCSYWMNLRERKGSEI